MLGAERKALRLQAVIERGDIVPELRAQLGLAFTTRNAWRTEATIEGGREAVNM